MRTFSESSFEITFEVLWGVPVDFWCSVCIGASVQSSISCRGPNSCLLAWPNPGAMALPGRKPEPVVPAFHDFIMEDDAFTPVDHLSVKVFNVESQLEYIACIIRLHISHVPILDGVMRSSGSFSMRFQRGRSVCALRAVVQATTRSHDRKSSSQCAKWVIRDFNPPVGTRKLFTMLQAFDVPGDLCELRCFGKSDGPNTQSRRASFRPAVERARCRRKPMQVGRS